MSERKGREEGGEGGKGGKEKKKRSINVIITSVGTCIMHTMYRHNRYLWFSLQ